MTSPTHLPSDPINYDLFVRALTAPGSDMAHRSSQYTDEDFEFLHAALGCANEAGELADAAKNWFCYGQPFNRENAIEELGDLLFFTYMALNALGVTDELIKKMNMQKLSARYPEGRFTTEASKERRDKE